MNKNRDYIHVGTLGGGRETLDGFPEHESIALKFVEACSIIFRCSYEVKFCCVLGGITFE